MMRISLAVVVIALAACLFTGCASSGSCCSSAAGEPTSARDQTGRYVCRMDGGTRDTPGPCPKCGMMLK